MSEIRESIFQFQQSRLNEDNDRRAADCDAVPMVEVVEEVVQVVVQDIPASKFSTPDKKKAKAVKASTGEGKKSLISTLSFFTTPRPVRPALHGFF